MILLCSRQSRVGDGEAQPETSPSAHLHMAETHNNANSVQQGNLVMTLSC